MFCTRCGKECPDDAVVCMGCGCAIKTDAPVKSDTAAFGFGVLGFFIPLVGLILWLVWKDERPKRAKAAGIGAIVGVVVNFIWGMVAGLIFSTVVTSIISEIPYVF